MNHKEKKIRPFKRIETGYHNSAVKILAGWFDGKIEYPFSIENSFAFVPDVTCFGENIELFEVVYSHEIDGKKLGLMQYWSYLNNTPLKVYEIDAHYILKQTEKPQVIEFLNFYNIDLWHE